MGARLATNMRYNEEETTGALRDTIMEKNSKVMQFMDIYAM